MVGKLFRYEFGAFFRAVLPFQILMPAAALLLRIIQIFESESTAYDIVFRSSLIMFIITIAVAAVMVFVTAISRFYKNLFTAEGYLSFTLPVTVGSHIFAKLSVALLWILITLGTILVSVAIATFGDVLYELIDAFLYLVKYFITHADADFYLLIVELLLVVVSAIVMGLMLFYTCICIGQLAKKNRIVAAFGAYFGYYVITQVIGTIFLVLIMTCEPFRTFISDFINIFENNEIGLIHFALTSVTVLFAALSSLYLFISHRIMTRRLNLE